MAAAGGKGRIAIKDVLDPNAEKDPEYQKVVKEITEGQSKSGWLVGRGAFDRTDLQYIADFRESERQQELDLKDMETNEFAALRSKMDEGAAVPAGGGVRVATKDKKEIKPAAKLLPAVKIVSPRDSTAVGGPPLKRTRTGSPDAADAPAAGAQEATAAPAAAEQEEEAPPVQQGRAVHPEDSTQAQAALHGLLGGYDSGSDSESVEMGNKNKGGNKAPKKLTPAKPAVALPSAAELLGVEDEAVSLQQPRDSPQPSSSESGGST